MNPVMTFLVWSMSFGIPLQSGPDAALGAASVGPAARIRIDISATDNFKDEILRHVAQGFHGVGGVRLVEEDPQWTIKIVTLNVQDKEQQISALGLSVVVLEHGPHLDMLFTLTQAWHYILKAGLLQRDQPLEVGMRQLVAGIDAMPRADNLTVLSQHRMCLIPMAKLPAACQEIAKNFGEKYLGSTPATPVAEAQ